MIRCELCEEIVDIIHVLAIDSEEMGLSRVVSVCESCSVVMLDEGIDYEYVTSLDFTPEERLIH